jgi:hypothetical protein
MTENYPSVVRRYLSSFIDFWVIIIAYIISSHILEGTNENISSIRFGIPTIFFLLYEPILTSKFVTIGQLITGIRIRDDYTYKRIPIHKAYIRVFIKYILGFISFFSILFSNKSKAMHDYAINSIVLDRSCIRNGI